LLDISTIYHIFESRKSFRGNFPSSGWLFWKGSYHEEALRTLNQVGSVEKGNKGFSFFGKIKKFNKNSKSKEQ